MTARVLSAIASIFLGISIYGIIADTNTNYAQQLGRFSSNSNLGGLIGVGLSFYILSNYELLPGWKVLYTVCGAAALLTLLYTLTIRTAEPKRLVKSQTQRVVLSPEKRRIWMMDLLI
ncbi:hypothetical protein [Paenibacillus sp. CAA11]|uniref:hypothetical protein n=1 Tax=Paenibacillus sp. CAA11 TaxID=1532905 RepID=UPI00131F2D56|nr:hypothetical protein [Paenibacillus sp. CAA11]